MWCGLESAALGRTPPPRGNGRTPCLLGSLELVRTGQRPFLDSKNTQLGGGESERTRKKFKVTLSYVKSLNLGWAPRPGPACKQWANPVRFADTASWEKAMWAAGLPLPIAMLV